MASEWDERAKAMAYSLRLNEYSVKVVIDSSVSLARRELRAEAIRLIEREIAATSNTPYGKGQIVMARRIIEKLKSLG